MSAPELEGFSLLRYLWRQLTSMRNALILLLLLSIASIPGSLFPQRTQSPLKVREYFESNRTSAEWMDRFYLFDVYGSPWFSAIYILLFVSLIGCVLPRTWHYLKEVAAKPLPAPNSIKNYEFHQISEGSLDQAEQWFNRKKFRITRTELGISAEKGYLRETGNLIFHLSLILLLIGIASSSVFGMRGEAIVNVGERFVNTPTSYDNLTPGRFFNLNQLPPFLIKVENFSAEYDAETRQPLDYTLIVESSDSPKSESERVIVKVNKPLTFGDTRVYLQANGYSPLVTVRDKDGVLRFEGAVPFLPQDSNLSSIGAIKVPDMSPQLGFVGSFFPTAASDRELGGFSTFPELLNPRLLLAAYSGDLKMDSGKPQSVYRIEIAEMEKLGLAGLRIGESFEIEEVGSITFNGVIPWVNLQIVQDPGKQMALLGSILAIVALMVSLFTRSRRIWVKSNGEGLEVAGLALNRLPGLEEEIRELVGAIKEKR